MLPRETPAQIIETMTAILLACERRASIRDYAGWSAGHRRNLLTCRFISERIAPRFTFPLLFKDGDRIATVEELARIIEDVLLELPADQAFLLVGKDHDTVAGVRNALAATVARRLCEKYEISKIDNTNEMLRF